MRSAFSLERIQQYLTIEQEPKPTSGGIPPAYWPASGDLGVERLSARYSKVRTYSDSANYHADLFDRMDRVC